MNTFDITILGVAYFLISTGVVYISVGNKGTFLGNTENWRKFVFLIGWPIVLLALGFLFYIFNLALVFERFGNWMRERS